MQELIVKNASLSQMEQLSAYSDNSVRLSQDFRRIVKMSKAKAKALKALSLKDKDAFATAYNDYNRECNFFRGTIANLPKDLTEYMDKRLHAEITTAQLVKEGKLIDALLSETDTSCDYITALENAMAAHDDAMAAKNAMETEKSAIKNASSTENKKMLEKIAKCGEENYNAKKAEFEKLKQEFSAKYGK